MQNANYSISKPSYFEKITDTYLAFTAILVLAMSIISTIVFIARAADLQDTLKTEGSDSLRFFSYIVLYSPFLPIALYGSLDIITLLQRYALQRKFKKIAQNDPNSAVTVLNPEAIPNLGQVSYCLIDKTGTLTTGNYKIRTLITGAKHYVFDGEDITSPGLLPIKTTRGHIASRPVVDTQPRNEVRDKPNQLDHSVDIEIHTNEEGGHHKTSPKAGEFKFREDLEARFNGLVHQDQGQGAQGQRNFEETKEAASPTTNRVSFKIETDIVPTHKNAMMKAQPRKEGHSSTRDVDTPKSVYFDALGSITLRDDLFKTNSKLQLISDLEYSDKHLNELAKGMSLCHAARTHYKDDRYQFETANPEDIALLKLARSLGYEFEFSNRVDNPTIFQVRVHGHEEKYNILGVNEFSYKRRRVSVCVRDPDHHNGDPAMLYVKGTDKSMRDRITFERKELDVFNSLIAKNNEQGLKTIVLARRALTGTEADGFYKKYQSLKGSLYNSEEGLEQLADETENKLELLGIIGIQDEPQPWAKFTLDKLRKSNIKCWMVTGDTMEQAVSAGYEFGFFEERKDLYYINEGEYSEVRTQVRNILHQIKRKMDEKEGRLDSGTGVKLTASVKTTTVGRGRDVFRASVVLSGEAWKIILRDQYLYSNFAFICSITGTLVAHSMTPLQKKKLILMIKNRFAGSQIIMGVGDGLNDALMLQNSDIGVEVHNANNPHPANAGDVKISSLKTLAELLLVDGRNYSFKIQQSVNYIFYKSFFIGFPLFLFNWFCSFTGSAQFESMLIFMYSFAFTFFPILVHGAMGSSESSAVLMHFPALYLDCRIQRYKATSRFLFDVVIKSVIHSAIVFYLTMYCVQNSLGRDGKNPEFDIGMLVQYYAIIIITNLDVSFPQ